MSIYYETNKDIITLLFIYMYFARKQVHLLETETI